MTKIPQNGDPELLPKGEVVRPSAERNPFDQRGALKPEGPGPLPENFLEAPDIKGLPWTRKRGEEWTTPEFRGYVREWFASWLKARGLTTWAIVERANSARMSVPRLPEDQHYLLIRVERKNADGTRAHAETAIPFSRADRDRESARARLDLAGQALDALLSVQ